jgi:spermidine synthase
VNAALLVLLPAALLGLAGMLAGFGFLHQAQGVLGVDAQGLVGGPAQLLLGLAGGALIVSARGSARGLASRAALPGLARWLGAAAICSLALPHSLAIRAEGGASVVGELYADWLPFIWALLIGGALPWCAGVCVASGMPAVRATSAVLVVSALGAAVGARLSPAALLASSGAFLPAASALLLAALACLVLAAGQSASPGVQVAARARRERGVILLLSALLGGAVLVVGLAGMLRMLIGVHGDSIALRADAALALALGAGLGLLPIVQLGRLRPGSVAAGLAFLVAVFALDISPRLLGPDVHGSHIEPVAWLIAPFGLFGAWLLVGTAGAGFGRALAALGLGGALAGSFAPGLVVARLSGGTGAALQLAAVVAAAGGLLAVLGSRSFRKQTRGAVALRCVVALLALSALMSSASGAPVELPWQARPDDLALSRRVERPRGVAALIATRESGARLVVDGREALTGPAEARLGRRMGRLAAAMRPEARRALLIGRGPGHVLAGLCMTTAAQVECVEPSAALLALVSELPFPAGTKARGGPPGIVNAAPRTWLEQEARSYDLIVGGLVQPAAFGAGALLSREHFGAMRAALAEDGVVVQWFPLHRMGWPAFATVTNAFLDAFPGARLFTASLRSDVPLVALVGGLDRGLPGLERIDALLSASPALDGLAAAVDVLDLYVADGWTLMTSFRDEPMNTLGRPLAELLSQDAAGDETWLATTNLRRLAQLSLPLDTSSLQRRPIEPKQDRRLGAELTARSAALTGLMIARAARVALFGAAPGELSDDEQTGLQEELETALMAGWSAAPGHRDVRDALLERATELAYAERHGAAAELLGAAHKLLPDARLGGVLGGVLLRLRSPEQALAVLDEARAISPEDRTVLVNLGGALAMLRRDDEAREAWIAARDAFAPGRLPPLQHTALALLEAGDDLPTAREAAVLLRGAMPADDPWAELLGRLVEQSLR